MIKHTALIAVFAALSTVPAYAASSVYNLDSQRAANTTVAAQKPRPAQQRTQPAPQRQQAQQQPQQQQQQAPAFTSGNINEILQYADVLHFTDEQVQSIRNTISEFEPVATKYDAEMRISRMALSKALRNTTPDFAAAQEKIKGLTDTQFQLRLAMLDAYKKVYELMTQEQKAKYHQLMTEPPQAAARPSAPRTAAAPARTATPPAKPAVKQKTAPATPPANDTMIDFSDEAE